jgi:hypothetical protein
VGRISRGCVARHRCAMFDSATFSRIAYIHTIVFTLFCLGCRVLRVQSLILFLVIFPFFCLRCKVLGIGCVVWGVGVGVGVGVDMGVGVRFRV